MVTISKELDKTTKEHIINTPKTKHSIRKIKIDEKLKQHLLELKEYYKKFEGFQEDWFIFGGLFPLYHSTVGRRHKKYCEVSKVKKIKIHDIRHSHVSLLISIGTPITVVSEHLGHSDIQMTLNIYSHMFPKDEDKAVLNIEKLRHNSNF
ncbi:MAG: site-specific integrase [Bacilli bacterium]|nr:site-specific integrase [Bacilli bacterium]